jgi:hypothetical protein
MIETPKGTKILELTPEKIDNIWSRLQKIRGMFDDFVAGRLDIFLQGMLQPNTIWLELTDGNGLLYVTNVVVGLSANVHFVYWDRKLATRRKFTIECLQWIVNVCNLQKVNAIIPDFCTAAIHFAKRIGFKVEGVIRRYSLNNGRLYDAIHLGMIREEVLDGCRLSVDGRQAESGSDGPIQPDAIGTDEKCSDILPTDTSA